MITSAEIQNLIQPLLEAERIKLCDIRLGTGARRPLIQLFVDIEEGNITIDQCADFSRLVQDVLDLQPWAPFDYRLEVSSPGVTSPLREAWQFRKNIGRTIRHITEQGTERMGSIIEITADDKIRLRHQDGDENYSLAELAGARVVMESPLKQIKPKRMRNETRGR